METKYNLKNCEIVDNDLNYINCSGVANSKKVKNALRQQVKRRRKNTTIAAGNSHLVNKIVNALPSNVSTDFSSSGISNPIAIEETAVTMEEVLSSLPGFGIKSNKRRSIKRLSVAAQLEAGLVDLESPASILAYTSLRALLNRHTFQGLPLLYQRKLAQLLPAVDRQDAATSGLNNEFFARACQEWRKRLSEGEFTPENQHRLKLEAEKDKSKLDPWKLKHFEPIWEEKRELFMIQCGLHSLNNEQKFSNSLSLSKLRSSSESNLERNLTDFPHSDDALIKTKAEKLDLSIPRNSFDKSHSGSVDDHDMPKFDFSDRILDAIEDDENEEKVEVDHGTEDNDEDEVHDDEDEYEEDGDENDNDIEDVSDEESIDEIEDNDESDGELSDDNNEDDNINKYGDNERRAFNTEIGDEADDFDANNYRDEFDGSYYHENEDFENYEDENEHEHVVDENEDGDEFDDRDDDDDEGDDDDHFDDNHDEDDNNTEEDDDFHNKSDGTKKDIVNTSRANKRSHESDDSPTVNKQSKTRISIIHFDEQAQHCKAIMITNSKIIRHCKKASSKQASIEKSSTDCPDNRKKIKLSVQEKKESKKDETDKPSTPISDQSKFSCDAPIEDFPLKSAETFTFDNQNQLDLEYQDSDGEPKDSINSKFKFGTKDKFFSNDIEIDIASEKEKIFSNDDLDCEQRDPLNQLDNEADNNLTSGLSEVIEIDHETLQRIHDLEVQGEMQEAYEEISHCEEEIYPPIDIGIISNDIKISEKPDDTSIDQDQKMTNCVSAKSQEEAFQEANNYVCSEMLENDWTSSKKETEVSDDKEELVHWPFAAAAALGDEINVAVTTSDNHEESGLLINKKSDDNEENFETSNCFTMPASNLPSESIQIATPATSCLMKNMHSTQSSSIITIPQLQAIRFVQTNFQTTVERSAPDTTSKDSSICTYIQSTSNTTQNQSNVSSNVIQNKVCGNQEDIYNELNEENESQNQTHNIISESLIQQNMQTQSTVLFQQQTLLPLSSRQLITPIKSQQQSYYPMVMNVASKTNRCMGTQNNYRSSRISNREPNSNRSRNVPKEPLGAVNLERSYQICQAVIASSPNRDQLKAHLKPPPGLLIKEKSSGSSKSSTQSTNSSTAQRNWNSNQDEGTSNKPQGVMLQQIITTARQNCSEESLESNPALKGTRSNFEDFEQYVVVNRTEVNDSIPERASSAPPMPPHIDNTSIIHMVHGRPASAGEKPHQSVNSKKKENNLIKGNKMALSNSHIIHEDDLSYLCRCNIRQAMMVCRRCGAFCHDDCITPQFICAMCLLN